MPADKIIQGGGDICIYTADSVLCTTETQHGKAIMLLFSHRVVSDSLRPHGLQHVRPPCPSPSPQVCPSSCPLHRWCHPALGIFPVSLLFTSDDQNTGASASASVLPMSIQGWFPLSLTGLISLLSKGLLGVFSSTHSSKASIILRSAFFTVQLSHHWEDHVALTIWTCVGRVMSPLFNTLSRFVCVYVCVCVCVCVNTYISNSVFCVHICACMHASTKTSPGPDCFCQ